MDQEGLMFPKTQKKRKKRMKHPRSILHEKNGTCYLCMLLDGNHNKHLLLDEHHIFGGPNRIHSEEAGLKVWLCLDHHTMGSLAVHCGSPDTESAERNRTSGRTEEFETDQCNQNGN